MNDANIQAQINDINRKLDLLLDYMHEQKMKTTAVDDLVADLSIVGKDMYDTAVTELETRQVQLDTEEIKLLTVKLIKNIPTFLQMIDMLESITDLLKDATPMVNEMIIDFTKKLSEFEQKGYFEFAREMGNVIDKIVTSYSPDDIRDFSNNVVNILDTVKNVTQPETLKSLNKAVEVFNSMEMAQTSEYSMWKIMKEMNSPEVRKGMTFMITFLKNLTKENRS
jgi:uncharacterized protein YjgD (DUF1641 family)